MKKHSVIYVQKAYCISYSKITIGDMMELMEEKKLRKPAPGKENSFLAWCDADKQAVITTNEFNKKFLQENKKKAMKQIDYLRVLYE